MSERPLMLRVYNGAYPTRLLFRTTAGPNWEMDEVTLQNRDSIDFNREESPAANFTI